MDVIADRQNAEALIRPALRQVDQLLAVMPERAKRIAFLRRQIDGWHGRWAHFACEYGTIDPAPPAEWSATEFNLLLTDLHTRLSAELAAREAA